MKIERVVGFAETSFCLTGANVDDRDSRVWNVFTKVLYGKVLADRGYIKQELFESLFCQGIQLVHGLKAKMKNKLMPLWDKLMLRKRYIIDKPEALPVSIEKSRQLELF